MVHRSESITFVVAVNNQQVYEDTFLAAPIFNAGKHLQILKKEGYASASKAYNEGIWESKNNIIVFAHQDVYLPAGWADQLAKSIDALTSFDPEWGVAGVFGIRSTQEPVGYVYSSGLRGFIGAPFQTPVSVSTLDEMLLVLRKSSGLQFDEQLPGFHLYGTDICLEAHARGLRNYVLPCFAFHNSNGVRWLPMDFWKAYLYLRKKWKERLPVTTPCTRITSGCMPICMDVIRRLISKARGKMNPGCRVQNPELFYNEYILPRRKT